MFAANLEDVVVVSAISNTPMFNRRHKLFVDFQKMVEESGVDFLPVEVAFGDRQFIIEHDNVLHLRTVEEFWHKENAIQLGISQARKIWPHKKIAAWIDADCAPVGKSFRKAMEETWHELQRYEFVQMWEWLQSLDIYHAPIGLASPSFVANYQKYGTPYPDEKRAVYPARWGSPGLAWAANLKALDQIGGIPDAAVLGAGDWYLAHMLCCGLDIPSLDRYTPGYRNYWLQRQQLCQRWIKQDVGFVRGLWTHFFHGPVVKRAYGTREDILLEGQFDPDKDLKRDHQGLWQLETWEPRQIKMRDRIRWYFRERNEDSIDTGQKIGPY